MKAKPILRKGSVRLIIFLIVITLGMLWVGGQGLYTALMNRKPTVMSYDDYLKNKPKVYWLQLTNCFLSLPDASCVTRMRVITEVYAPVHSLNEPAGARILVLVATKAPEVLSLARELDNLTSKKEAEQFMEKNRDRLFPKKDVQGLVRFGLDLKSEEHSQLAALDKDLAPDFIIVDDGKKPEFATSLGLFLAGLAIPLVMLKIFRHNSEEE